MRKIKIYGVIIFALLIFGYPIASGTNRFGGNSLLPITNTQRLNNIITNVKRYYYKEIDDGTLMKQAIIGMLAGLDPHSSYLEASDLKDLEMETFGKFGGIGVEVVPDQGAIKVISPLDDTPAYRAGIKAGDYIVQINGKLVRDMTLRDAINMMRGPRGSRLNLTIIRKNASKPLVFSLRRETIKIKTVKERMLEPGYAYIRIALFQDPTEKDLVLAIKRLRRQTKGGLKGIILDLRNNPGGLFESAVKVADDFLDSSKLKKNDLIVYTKGQSDAAQISAKATPGELLPGVPVVVLINEGSASASEIVAGALQDHKRAIVIGGRTFGKGSVQTLIPIDKNSAIKLTTALYYTPLGHSIQAKGIEPDINVGNIQLAQKKQEEQGFPRVDESSLVDHIHDIDGEKGEGEEDFEKDEQRSKAELELAYKDYQLYEALHILKSQNVMWQR